MHNTTFEVAKCFPCKRVTFLTTLMSVCVKCKGTFSDFSSLLSCKCTRRLAHGFPLVSFHVLIGALSYSVIYSYFSLVHSNCLDALFSSYFMLLVFF